MKKGVFQKVAAFEGKHSEWNTLTSRQRTLYKREEDILRSPFARDYTRILHSTAYRRLKHKTQVFFNIENDHICTRMEHVHHVESVSATIAQQLGLNVELTRAIAIGHDLGHAPSAIRERRSYGNSPNSFLEIISGTRKTDCASSIKLSFSRHRTDTLQTSPSPMRCATG